MTPAHDEGPREGCERRDPAFGPLEGWLLAAALALGALRFVRLGAPSLWIDEVLTWSDSHAAGTRYNEPGYAIVRAVVEWLGRGPDEAALRLAPALAGWLAIPLTVFALAPLAGVRRAVVAALVVAVSPWQLYWSQTARFYTLAECCVLAGAGLYLRGIARGHIVAAVLGLLVAAAGALFQLQALLIVAALGAGVVLARPAGALRRRAALAGLAGLVLFCLSLPFTYRVFEEYRRAKGGGSLGDAMHALLALGHAIGPTLGVCFLAGACAAFAERDGRGRLAVAVALVGTACIVALGFVVTTSAQYAFVFLPFVALVAAWPVGPGGALERAPLAIAWTAVLALPLLAASALQLGPGMGDRPRWREAFAHVEAHRRPGDVVLSLPGPMAEHYLAPGRASAEGFASMRVPERAGALDDVSTRTHERFLREPRPMWLVVRPDFVNTWEPGEQRRFREFLRRECRLDARFPVRVEARDLDVEVWRRE